jgi:translation initiation factor 2 gamma subunit (eIF-2gamma)
MSKINVGTIGHVDHGKTTITAALMLALANTEFEVIDRQTPIYITKMPDFPEPVFCGDVHKKSKGEKKRERHERRRKWGI